MARPSSSSSSSRPSSSSSRKSSGGPRPPAPPSSSSSCTPSYVPIQDRPIQPLTDDEQLDVVTQLMGFPARKLLFDIHEAANAEIFDVLVTVEKWLETRTDPSSSSSSKSKPPSNVTAEALERELDTGMHAMETLLTAQMDAAMELFMSWSYRNAFTVGEWGGVVLPAHENLDFPRGQYVAESLDGGEHSLDLSIDALRAKVEQKRLLLQTLQKASLRSKHSLAKAKALSEELAFFKETAKSYNLAPLPQTLTTLVSSLSTLQTSLAALPSPATLAFTNPQPNDSNDDGSAGLGRAAFINRVEERAIGGLGAAAGGGGGGGGLGGEDRLEAVERELERVGRGMEVDE
ncbi:hypothetical protein BDY24DRAFT_440111 [Mrakia frigida]|uniref:uncharacterized protein n=1 Tax=Mrakia frigida TaxID=29902 RepID=UPI003FCBFAFF